MDSVERGAALLDEKVPGWEAKIDLDTLDLYVPCKCVLGQLFGRGDSAYTHGLHMLNLFGFKEEIAHGFEARSTGTYTSLTTRWRRVIRRRLKAQS